MISQDILDAVVARLKAYAIENYSKGWDVVVECWEKADYVDYINRAASLTSLRDEETLYKDTLDCIREYINLYEEQCRNTRFE